MFCKWCGADLPISAVKCTRCGREVPPKSDCGGFFDLPVSQTVNIPNNGNAEQVSVDMTETVALLKKSNTRMRKNFSKLTAIMCGCFMIVLALLAVMLVRVWGLPGQVEKLEKQVKALSAGKEDTGLKEEDVQFGIILHTDRIEESGIAQIFPNEPAAESYSFRFAGTEKDAFFFKAAAKEDKICVTLQYKESVFGKAEGDPKCKLSYQKGDDEWTDLSAPEVTVEEESVIEITFPTEEIEELLEKAGEEPIEIRLTCSQKNKDGGSFTFTVITTPEE